MALVPHLGVAVGLHVSRVISNNPKQKTNPEGEYDKFTSFGLAQKNWKRGHLLRRGEQLLPRGQQLRKQDSPPVGPARKECAAGS